MRKIFFFLMFCLLSITAIKADTVWDFTKGFSEETVNGLAADDNWGENGDTRYNNAVTMSDTLQLNGKALKETDGISFGSLSSGKFLVEFGSNPPCIRLNGSGLDFTVHGMVAGKKMTIITQSANSSDPRGITCRTSNVSRLSGDEKSLVENTNVFQVDESVTDTLDVTFRTTGGLKINYIKIENDHSDFNLNDGVDVAYVYNSSNNSIVGGDEDYVYAMMQQYRVNTFDISTFGTPSDSIYIDSLAALENYDVVLVSNSVSATDPFGIDLGKEVCRVPMLNMSVALYGSDAWNIGSVVTPSSPETSMKVYPEFQLAPYFANIDVESSFDVFTGDVTDKNMILGYEPAADSYIANDSVVAYYLDGTDTVKTIHKHGKKNTYMLFPVASDAIETLTESSLQFIYDAVASLAATKGDVSTVFKPSIDLTYNDGITYAVISSLTDDARTYYTTDGTEPTKESSYFTDTLSFTDTCTIKAFAVKQGYDDSKISSKFVAIKSKTVAPEVEITEKDGKKVVVMTCSDTTATIYYTTTGTDANTLSNVYSDTLYFVRPASIHAVAMGAENALLSDQVAKEVIIDGYVERNAMMMYADFKNYPSIWMWGDMEEPAGGNIDVISNYTYIEPTDSTAPYDTAVVFTNGFKVGTQGQRINLQSTGTKDDIGSSYGPYSSDDAGATSFAMTFLRSLPDKGPATAYIVTPKAYSGPLNIDVWLTGGRGETSKTELCEVSYSTTGADGSWTVIDTLTTLSDKLIRKRTAYYDGNEAVYLKFAAVSKNGKYNNMMIFDVKVSGQGEVVPAPEMVVDTTEAGTTNLTIADDEAGVEIYYTTSGYAPTQDSTKYTTPLTFTEETTINAYAVREGKYISDVITYTVPIKVINAIDNATTEKELVSEEIYTISGVKLNSLGTGLNIVVDKYSDGTVETKKIILNQK